MNEIEEFFNAAIDGDLSAINSLLKRGVDVNVELGGETALMAAASSGQAAVVRVLLKHGANINARDETQSTALHWAARYGIQREEPGGGLSVIKALTKAGADVSATDDRGNSALDFAVAEDNQQAIKLLTPIGQDFAVDPRILDDSLVRAAAYNKHVTAKKFLQKGANVNARGNAAWTPLMHAVHNHNERSVKMYLEAGADASVKDSSGQSILQLARLRNNPIIIDLLIAAGAVD